MGLIEINRNPSKKDLKWFGLVLAAFAGVVGLIVQWKFGSPGAAKIIWIVGAALAAIYYAIPPLRKHMFVGWMILAFPIGFVLSSIIMALAYYLMFTPIALFMKLIGRDALNRKIDRDADTYWVPIEPVTDPSRYYRQF